MSTWLVSIAGIVALSVLLDIIVPEGETNKYIKGIFSLITIFVIISPVVAFVSQDMSFDDFIGNDGVNIEIDNTFINNANQDINLLTEESLEKYLNELGYKNLDVRIYLDYDNNLSYVLIDINNLSIDDNLSHINITDNLKEKVSKSLNVERERVIIYGIYRG